MTFLKWCHLQARRPDSIGDFARDWVADRDRPRAPSEKEMESYLEDRGAIDEAIEAGKRCYGEWLRAHRDLTRRDGVPHPAAVESDPMTPRTEAGKRLLEREALNSRSFTLITAADILAIEVQASDDAYQSGLLDGEGARRDMEATARHNLTSTNGVEIDVDRLAKALCHLDHTTGMVWCRWHKDAAEKIAREYAKDVP